MKQDRLESLLIISFESDVHIDNDEVVDVFAKSSSVLRKKTYWLIIYYMYRIIKNVLNKITYVATHVYYICFFHIKFIILEYYGCIIISHLR
jgi:hypothetical protein